MNNPELDVPNIKDTKQYEGLTKVLEEFKTILYNSKSVFFRLVEFGYNNEEINYESDVYFGKIKEIIADLETTIKDRKYRFDLYQNSKPQPTCRTGNCD